MIVETQGGLLEITRDGDYSIVRALGEPTSWVVKGAVAWSPTSAWVGNASRLFRFEDGWKERHETFKAIARALKAEELTVHSVEMAVIGDVAYFYAGARLWKCELGEDVKIKRVQAQVASGGYSRLDSGQLCWTSPMPSGILYSVQYADDEWTVSVERLGSQHRPSAADSDGLQYVPKTMVVNQICAPFYLTGARLLDDTGEYRQPDGTPFTLTPRHFLMRREGEVWLCRQPDTPFETFDPVLLIPRLDMKEAEERFEKRVKIC